MLRDGAVRNTLPTMQQVHSIHLFQGLFCSGAAQCICGAIWSGACKAIFGKPLQLFHRHFCTTRERHAGSWLEWARSMRTLTDIGAETFGDGGTPLKIWNLLLYLLLCLDFISVTYVYLFQLAKIVQTTDLITYCLYCWSILISLIMKAVHIFYKILGLFSVRFQHIQKSYWT